MNKDMNEKDKQYIERIRVSVAKLRKDLDVYEEHIVIDGDGDVAIAGDVIIGDGVTNYASIADDGKIRLHGTAKTWDDLRFAAAAVKSQVGKPPEWKAIGLGEISLWQFIKNAENAIGFEAQLPHAWKEGSTLKPHVHWMPMDTDTGDVEWFLEYTIANIGEVFGAPTTISVVDAGDGTARKHQETDLPDITMAGKTISNCLLCRLYRDGGQGNDNYDNYAGLIEVDFHFELDSLGSDTEETK